MHVQTILVKQSSLNDPQPFALVGDTVDFVNTLQAHGAFLPEELPRDALRAYHCDDYLAQVMNGGHGQFVGNRRWPEPMIRDIAEGLAAMQAEPYARIFAELRTIVARHGSWEQAETAPELEALDDRFFALDAYQTFSPRIAAWLRGLPILEPVPDADLPARLEALRHPDHAARLAERAHAAEAARAREPLWVAGRMLCALAGCAPMGGLVAGDPTARAPDGREGAWTIATAEENKVLFLFDDVAILCDAYLADGSRVTQARMQAHFAAIEADPDDLHLLDVFSEVTHRELARIPASQVQAAVRAAGG
ncbi:hypothetical protein BKE38_19785 [Pseudoroseomonas deserti]|uniref:DNA mimic protein DMP19 C-terminal domain-containing protein n=1 Tax=Teichococcus deserti TaxID=1817963 RepID=A0A1V2GYM8_9PROT|nr:DUF4375 domain-containing protein [Pseudoroseomonas deserti]ONG50031.1 hypothetical protein BKE38_19785 [Pseudoroseomonas deserti]